MDDKRSLRVRAGSNLYPRTLKVGIFIKTLKTKTRLKPVRLIEFSDYTRSPDTLYVPGMHLKDKSIFSELKFERSG